jgi:hypothetical protein
LNLTGAIRFAPGPSLGPMTECINSWQKAFSARVVMPYMGNSMIGSMTPSPASIDTDWSGYVVSAPISPVPLEAMFVENPRLLADCQIGLTVEKVSRALDGAARDYLSGIYQVEIQPLPSQINLARASVEYGDMKYQAEPELSGSSLIYDVQK